VKIIFICTKSITFNTFLNSQASYFLKKGIKVEVACSDIENLKFKKNLRYKIEFPKKLTDFFNLIKYIKIFYQIKKLVKKNNSNIFYLHTPSASHIFRFFTFFDKLKIIYFVHGFRFTLAANSLKIFFFKIIENVLSITTDVFITINNEDYNYSKINFFKKALCFKVKGIGLNLSAINNKKKIKKKERIKRILVIAAYKKEKGYFDILKVAENLRYEKIKIECYGYGNFNKFNLIKLKNKLHNLTFNNFDINLKNKIQRFDILLHLSKREGLPVSVMQSLSKGLPVICYNIRGNNDLIKNRVNGFFIKTYNDAANKIRYLNSNKDIFNKMRLNSIKSINEDYSKKQINLKIYNIIKNYSKLH
jgi:glycosyltransferase involved in cell wall biosynthesis